MFLNHAIYVLKHAPREWYAKIDSLFVNEYCSSRTAVYDFLYIGRDANGVTTIAVCVDDLLFACSSLIALVDAKKQLSSCFRMKDLGKACVTLGMDIFRDRSAGSLSLLQSRYSSKIVSCFGMSESKST